MLQTMVLALTLTLTFQPKTIPLAGYPKVIPYIKFEHIGIIRFWVMLHEKQTDSKILPSTHAIVGVNNSIIL